ncbi:MAG: hypothetical protein WC483_00435 [Candidatus Paceibacterota bacterium]
MPRGRKGREVFLRWHRDTRSTAVAHPFLSIDDKPSVEEAKADHSGRGILFAAKRSMSDQRQGGFLPEAAPAYMQRGGGGGGQQQVQSPYGGGMPYQQAQAPSPYGGGGMPYQQQQYQQAQMPSSPYGGGGGSMMPPLQQQSYQHPAAAAFGGMAPQYQQQAPSMPTFSGAMMQQQASPQPSMFITFNSPPTKLIAWSLLRALLRVYTTDTTLPAPAEAPVEGRDTRVTRFCLTMLSLSEHVHNYTSGSSNASIDAMIGEKLVTPFLEALMEEFPRYGGTKIAVSPFFGTSSFDPMLTENIHQLHALFSVIYLTSLPGCFDYRGIPLHQAMMFAQSYIKLMLSTLFKRMASGELENRLLFEAIGKNYPVLMKLQSGTFMQDRMQDATFLETSVVSNRLVDVLRRTAISCFNSIASIWPCLHTNPAFQNGLTNLQFAQKAF